MSKIHEMQNPEDVGCEFEVWLDLDDEYSGMCIGAGNTRHDAIQEAVADLEGALRKLRALHERALAHT